MREQLNKIEQSVNRRIENTNNKLNGELELRTNVKIEGSIRDITLNKKRFFSQFSEYKTMSKFIADEKNKVKQYLKSEGVIRLAQSILRTELKTEIKEKKEVIATLTGGQPSQTATANE